MAIFFFIKQKSLPNWLKVEGVPLGVGITPKLGLPELGITILHRFYQNW